MNRNILTRMQHDILSSQYALVFIIKTYGLRPCVLFFNIIDYCIIHLLKITSSISNVICIPIFLLLISVNY